MFDLKSYQNLTDFSNIELSAKEAILAKCWDCCCYDAMEVKECNIKTCPLHQYKVKWYKVPRTKNLNDKRSNNGSHLIKNN